MNIKEWQALPQITNSSLLFQDTTGYPLPGKIVPCLLCTKPFLMRAYTGFPDQICGECWETYKDTARVVCFTCKVTICRLVPKVLESGYYIKPRSVLHAEACNICQPGIKESTIVEIAQWESCVREKKIIITGGSK